ncbi:MAG: hypothetical protein KIT16_04975 [Rhodospirillaceae bacterium]|nr:hypothetical protein [Rhodospirillaceae bacterium]
MNAIFVDIEIERKQTHTRARRMLLLIIFLTLGGMLGAGALVFQTLIADAFDFRSKGTRELEKSTIDAREYLSKAIADRDKMEDLKRRTKTALSDFEARSRAGSTGMSPEAAAEYYRKNWFDIIDKQKLDDLRGFDTDHLRYDSMVATMLQTLQSRAAVAEKFALEAQEKVPRYREDLTKSEEKLAEARREDRKSLLFDANNRTHLILITVVGLFVFALIIPIHNIWRFLMNKEQALYVMKLAVLLLPTDSNAMKRIEAVMDEVQKVPGGIPVELREILDKYAPKTP